MDLVILILGGTLLIGIFYMSLAYQIKHMKRPKLMRDQSPWMVLVYVLILGILPGILFVLLMDKYDERIYDKIFGKKKN